MLRQMNRYCSNCLRTQRFLDLGTHMVCECCSKRLIRIQPVVEKRETAVVGWAERTEQRRDAM